MPRLVRTNSDKAESTHAKTGRRGLASSVLLSAGVNDDVLRRLPRSDLEALGSLKLWSEVGVPFDVSLDVLRRSGDDWIVRFLGSAPLAIGGAPLDFRTLGRARERYRRRLHARDPSSTHLMFAS